MQNDRTHETHGAAGTGAATAAAKAPAAFDEPAAKAALSPYEQKLSTFINRRIGSEPNVQVLVAGRKVEALEYLPGGEGLGMLKVQTGSQEPEWVAVDDAVFETLLAKIIHD